MPGPDLVRAVVPEPLMTAPLRVLASVLVPPSVRVLAPTPVAVSALENTSAPEPEDSMVAPPVVPARLTTRSDVWPLPV